MSAAGLLAFLRRQCPPPTSDAELLRAYADGHDTDAFRALLERHGPLVLRLCRRRLRDVHAAEDAFQATFLILARSAGTVRRPEALAAWLYGVALRVTRKARIVHARRQRLEADAEARQPPDPAAELTAREMLDALDEELHRLPERYRLPLWLCYWQGLTQDETARRLGWSPGSVKDRLERGRKRLADRLTRRGFSPPALLAAPLAAVALVPGDLLARTATIAAAPWSKTLPLGVAALAAATVASNVVPATVLVVVVTGIGLVGLVANLRTGHVLHGLGRISREVAFTPDGKTLLANVAVGLRIWETATGLERFRRPPELGLELAMSVSPDGRQLATATWTDQDVTLWNLADGSPVRSFPRRADARNAGGVAFSSDGRTLATVQDDGWVQFWDAASGQERRAVHLAATDLAGRPDVYYRLHLSSDERRIVALIRPLHRPGTTQLVAWDAGDGRPVAQQSLPINQTDWAWSRDEEVVVVPVYDGVATHDGATLRKRYQIAENSLGATAASPTGRLLAARKVADGTDDVSIWDLDTGHAVGTVPVGKVTHLAIAPDDRTLVTTGADGMLRIWDLATGRERGRREMPTNCTALVLTPDGRRALTAFADSTGLVWELSTFPAERLARAAGEKQIAAWCSELASDDARKVHEAVWRLADAPAAIVVPLLSRHLRPSPLDADAVRRAVADLNHESFTAREAATKRLEAMGGGVVPDLRRAVAAAGSPEVRRRLEGLIDRLSTPISTPKELRRLRAVGVLERLGTADARALLADLADGPVHPQESRAARAAFGRLGAR
jgi:RNA polymerase sigma factor (sigma-70 family)